MTLKAAILVLGVAGLVALTGCNQDLPGVVYEKPRQAEAMELVWSEIYGMAAYARPTIYWVEGADLDCSWDPDAWQDGGEDDCRYGRSTTKGAAIAWSPGRSPYSAGSFAHELLHWRGHDRTGDDNDDHQGPDWQPGGLLDQATAALAAAGL